MAANTHALFSNSQVRQNRLYIAGADAEFSSVKGLTAFTWEAWVKLSPDWRSDLNVLSRNAVWYEAKPNKPNINPYTRPRFTVNVSYTQLRFSLSVNDDDGLTHYTYPYDFRDQWTHIAFAVDTGLQEYDIMINGVLVQTGTLVGGGLADDDSPVPISDTVPSIVSAMRGYYNNIGSPFALWNGAIDCVRLWNNRRGENAVRDAMDDFVTTSVPNLLYQFDADDVDGNSRVYGARSSNITGTPYMLLHDQAGLTTVVNKTTDRPFLGDGNVDTTPPTVPTMKAHTDIGPTGFTLNWNLSTDNVAVQNYILDVASDSGFTNHIEGFSSRNVGRETSITFESGAPNSIYYARVRAIDTMGNASGWSSYAGNAPIVTNSTSDYTAPSIPPQNLRVTSVTPMSFRMEWDRGATADEVAGYKVFVGLNPSFSVTVPAYRNYDVGLREEFTFSSDILPLTTYWVKVRSYDQNANESWDSDTIQVVTRPLPDVEAPEEVSLISPTSVEATRFTLRWLPTTDNIGVEGYLVDIARDADFTQSVGTYRELDVGNVQRCNIFGLGPQTTYFARVRAYDAAGNISVFESAPQQITTASLTSSADGVIEAGTQAREFIVDSIPVEENVPLIGVGGPASNPTLAFSAVSVIGEPHDLEMFLWVDQLSGSGELLVYHGDVLLARATPLRSEAWVSIQMPNVPHDLLAGTSLELRTTDTLALQIGTGLTNENPAPLLNFTLDTEQVIKPMQSELSVDFETVRNYIPSPDFLHVEKRGQETGVSAGVTDDYVTESNWAVTVRRVTMVNGGDFTFNSRQITDSATKLKMWEPLRGAIYLGMLNNAGTKASAQFEIRLGVEYDDGTTNVKDQTVEVVDGLHPFWVDGLQINQAKGVRKVYLRISSVGTFQGSIAAYMPTIYQAPERLYPFSGNTYSGRWEEEANYGTSTISYPKVSGQLSYIGDSDNSGTARLALISREVGVSTNTWYGTSIATKDSEAKVFTATAKSQIVVNQLGNGSFDIMENTTWYPSLLGVGHTIDLDFGGINLDGDQSRNGFRHLNVRLTNKDAATSDMWFGVGNSQVIAKHALNGSSFKAYVRGVEGAVLRVTFQDSSSPNTVTLYEHTMKSNAWEEVSFDIPLNKVPFSGYIRLHMNTQHFQTGQKFSVDGVQVGATVPFFADELFKGAYALGDYGASPVVAFLPYQGTQDVIWLVDDPDGVDHEHRLGKTGVIGDVAVIDGAPDNIMTVTGLTAVATEHSLRVVFDYTGNDNGTADVDIKWKRADLTEERAWNRVPVSWNRDRRQVSAIITDLTPLTNYSVVATAKDQLLPVYGENPIQRNFITSAPKQKALSSSKVMFGGFVLQDDNADGIWVESHDAFNHPERETKVEKMPRNQGSVELSDWWGERRIRMKGGISGRNRQELAEKITALRVALARGRQRLVIDTLDSRSFYFTATCTSFQMPEEAGVNFRHLTWDATFVCADPFRYDSKEVVESDVSLMNSETYKVTNHGDLSIAPRITVKTTSPTNIDFTLINQSTGERITPVTKIKSGDTLHILSDELKITKNGVPIDFSGSFLSLDTGDNTLEVQTFPISYPVILTIRRRHKYF